MHRAGIKGRLGSTDNLLTDEGDPIKDYSLVFQELFCLAASDLAADLDQPLDRIGVLYEEIIPSGNPPKDKKSKSKSKRSEVTVSSSLQDVERDVGHPSLGRGQLFFLVSRVGRREADNLEAAGFRFAAPAYVIPTISRSLQIGPHTLARKLDAMRQYAYEPHTLDPGVHLACFAIRASLSAGKGFDILARKDAKNQLPTMLIPIGPLEVWHCDYLMKMDSLSVSATLKILLKESKPKNSSEKERIFAQILFTGLEALKNEIEDPLFGSALLIAKPIEAPCREPGAATLITFKIIVPIGSRAPGKKLVFVPLSFFKAEQYVYPNSPNHRIHAMKTYRDFTPVLDLNHQSVTGRGSGNSYLIPSKLTASSVRRSRHDTRIGDNLNMFGDPIDQSQGPDRGPSKIRFWEKNALRPRVRRDNSSERYLVDTSEGRTLGSIMISQDINVEVGSPGSPGSSKSRRPGSPSKKLDTIEMDVFNKKSGVTSKIGKEEEKESSFVDELFTLTVNTRRR